MKSGNHVRDAQNLANSAHFSPHHTASATATTRSSCSSRISVSPPVSPPHHVEPATLNHDLGRCRKTPNATEAGVETGHPDIRCSSSSGR